MREATGPAADFFHRQVGNPDGEALALFAVKPLEKGQDASRVPARQRISPALEQAWNEYLDRFERHYQLTEEQKTLAQSRMDQAKDQAVRWLLGEQQKGGRDSTLVVEKSFNGAAVVKVKQTSRQRIDAYRANVEDLRRIMNEKLPAFGRDVEKGDALVVDGFIDNAGRRWGGQERPAAASALYIYEGNLLPIVRPTRARRIPLQICQLFRSRTISGNHPRLFLIAIFTSAREKYERLGIRRPRRIGIGPFAGYPKVNQCRGRIRRCPANVCLLRCCRGRRLHPGDIFSVGRKRTVAVKDGFTQLFGELHVLSC